MYILYTQNTGNNDDQIYWQDSSVEGTSQSLEKAYLRLTSVSSSYDQLGLK